MYLLDTNAFLTPAATYYAFDICGGYWDWLADAAVRGELASIDRVKGELRQKDDHIKNWIDFHAQHLFRPETAAVVGHMRTVATWVTGNGYQPAAVSEFLGKADSLLVAAAMDCGGVVVTLESRAPNSHKRVKIPDACDAHGIQCITPYELLRRHGVRLVK
jgi:hypothetical protein